MEIVKEGHDSYFILNGKKVVLIKGVENGEDTFMQIDTYAYKWTRKLNRKIDNMHMEALLIDGATFTMVPAVNYNGNGWGDVPEYTGDNFNGVPWSYASHRVTIPSCTYSENNDVSLSLMADANTNTACSLYKTDCGQKHVIIYPEEEQPKTLQRHFWGDAFQGKMEPQDTFEAIILVVPSDGSKHRYKDLLDFAWRYYGHAIKSPKSAQQLYDLGIAYCRWLLEKEQNGFIGFTMGSQWHISDTSYHKTTHRYEIGWVGQSASMANAYIFNYIKTGNRQDLQTAIEVHDAWIKFGKFEAGHIASRIDYDPWRKNLFPADFVPNKWEIGEAQYESQLGFAGKKFRRDKDGLILLSHDSCNIGTAAEEYFEAYDLLKSIDIDKQKYFDTAIDICEFALKNQDENGSYAKSWDDDGNVLTKDGTIGCFFIIGILEAYKHTNDKKFLNSAVKSFEYYYSALEKDGFTTAGALDTYSIDKESASPLLRDALALYEITSEKKYIDAAEKIAWYLCTWMMHYTINYPNDSMIGQMGYDTFGSTSVSTPHQALDQYALKDVLSFIKLHEITGYEQWLERAKAFWCNACQCISDGTMYINGRLRPAGAQDEAIFHTRWSRHAVPPFMPSQWLPAWPTAFRLENLRKYKDWSFFDEGLNNIKGKIK